MADMSPGKSPKNLSCQQRYCHRTWRGINQINQPLSQEVWQDWGKQGNKIDRITDVFRLSCDIFTFIYTWGCKRTETDGLAYKSLIPLALEAGKFEGAIGNFVICE